MGFALSLAVALVPIVPSLAGATRVPRTVFAEEIGWIG
jgi:hypothetical protein